VQNLIDGDCGVVSPSSGGVFEYKVLPLFCAGIRYKRCAVTTKRLASSHDDCSRQISPGIDAPPHSARCIPGVVREPRCCAATTVRQQSVGRFCFLRRPSHQSRIRQTRQPSSPTFLGSPPAGYAPAFIARRRIKIGHRFPKLVDRVILLGSPIHKPQDANPYVKVLDALTQLAGARSGSPPPSRKRSRWICR
jgi:hypothetical protein